MSTENPIINAAGAKAAENEFGYRGVAEIVAHTDPAACKGYDLAKLIQSANAVAASGGAIATAGTLGALSGMVLTGGMLTPESGLAAGCAAMAAVAGYGLGGKPKSKTPPRG